MRDSEDLDRLLDAALAGYADGEASPDLNAKIIAQVQQKQSRRSWHPWAIAIPALAALLLLASLLPMHRSLTHRRASPAAAIIATVAPPPPRPAAERQPAKAAARPPSRRSTNLQPARRQISPEDRSLPRQEVFPTPTPLTPQEQALAALATRNPGNVSQSVVAAEKQPVEPLEIAAIRIKPLNPPDQSQNSNTGQN